MRRCLSPLAASLALIAAPVAAQTPRLTEVATFDDQVTGVAVSERGRVFVNFPRWNEDVAVSVAEVVNGRAVAFPNAEWNRWRNANKNAVTADDHFVNVQSVVADGRGGLWAVDSGAPNAEFVVPGAPKLVRIDLATNRVARVIALGADVAPQGSYMNDIRFSADGRTAFLTDSGARGALIVVDLAAGRARRVLDGHPSTQVERDVSVTIDGRPLRRPDGRQPEFAADGLAVMPDGYLYWQALTGKTLYRIATDALADARLTPDALAARIERVAEHRVADGLLATHDGRLLLTAPERGAVHVMRPDRTIATLVRDARMRWPDSLAEGPDGAIYVTASRIQDNGWFKPGAQATLRTTLFRVTPAR